MAASPLAGMGRDVYIDWNGNVMSCVFSLSFLQNIREVHAEGGDFNTILYWPFFRSSANGSMAIPAIRGRIG
jgi:hypothetical protein